MKRCGERETVVPETSITTRELVDRKFHCVKTVARETMSTRIRHNGIDGLLVARRRDVAPRTAPRM